MIHTLYFGTYTKRLSQGIYRAKFDAENGKLSDCEIFSQTQNPTYLSWSDKESLLAVKQIGSRGGIASFDSEGREINHILAEGAPLCHLSFDKKRQLAYGANYHKGEISVYHVDSDGQLKLADCVKHEGKGPHPNQTTAHAHFVGLTPDNFLVTCDLGSDQVITYDVTDQTKLKMLNSYQTKAGAGPRHLIFYPHLNLAYVLCELNAQIEILSYHGKGQFDLIDTISTIPRDYKGFNATAAIRISSDNHFLYISNRGHNSIAAYKILADGHLELLQIENSKGDVPRDFTLSPNENHLIVAHQESDNISIFKRDPQSGMLNLMSNDFYIPECVCLLFK
ncbi:lactonase family protein [Streptococcus thoraltensis]|uniref:lactonase family protein n=1 Tax=Streptococcus thoraltensis TaxID=55085 RepID=UPI001F5652E6|nr:lactonase family protein [Streptococcus thoraltensis]